MDLLKLLGAGSDGPAAYLPLLIAVIVSGFCGIVWVQRHNLRHPMYYVKLLLPAGLLLLIWIPFDLPTAPAWLFSMIVAFVAAFKLIKTLVMAVVSKQWRTSQAQSNVADLCVQKLLLPILCIVCYVFASQVVSASVRTAKIEALEVARNAIVEMDRGEDCHSVLIKHFGQNRDDRYQDALKSTKQAGGFGTQYYLSMKCTGTDSSFEVWVRESYDTMSHLSLTFFGTRQIAVANVPLPPVPQ